MLLLPFYHYNATSYLYPIPDVMSYLPPLCLPSCLTLSYILTYPYYYPRSSTILFLFLVHLFCLNLKTCILLHLHPSYILPHTYYFLHGTEREMGWPAAFTHVLFLPFTLTTCAFSLLHCYSTGSDYILPPACALPGGICVRTHRSHFTHWRGGQRFVMRYAAGLSWFRTDRQNWPSSAADGCGGV